MKYNEILKIITKYLLTSKEPFQKQLQSVCQILFDGIPNYNWVGFYSLKDERLRLGPYAGDPTEHVGIKIGEGICGQAAATKKIFIVDDVSKESNYFSCSSKVKSEIVIPIIKEGAVWGELDIDSYQINAFSKKDKDFLEKILKKIDFFIKI